MNPMSAISTPLTAGVNMSGATDVNINVDSDGTCTTADPSIPDLDRPGTIITIDNV